MDTWPDMNRRSPRSRAAVLAALLGLLPASISVAGKWEKLEDCRLRPAEYLDGDSFHVEHSGKEHIFRLYYVDAPETDPSLEDRIEEQAAYWDVSKADVMKIGRRARRFTERRLKGEFTVYTQWEDAGGSSGQPRYFAVVLLDRENLAESLVREGLARVYGASADLPDGTSVDSFFERLRSHEVRAKSKKLGAWGDVAGLPDESEEGPAGGGPAEAGAEEAEEAKPSWPNVPTVAFLRAEAFINLERFEEAEGEMTALLERHPGHAQKPRIEFYRALSVAMHERFDEAIPEFERLIREYPEQAVAAEARYWLPISLYYDGQHERAAPLFADYVAAFPLSVYAPEAEYRAALCRYALEDFRSCALALGGWLEKYPDHYFHWEALVTRGDALAAVGRLDEAKADYLRVTAAGGPFQYLALSQAAKVFKALATTNDYLQMAGAFTGYVRENPESASVVDAAYQAGWALRQIGRAEEARQIYWRTITRYGNGGKWEGFEPLLRDLAGLYREAGSGAFEQALREARLAALQEGRWTLASRLALAEIRGSGRAIALADVEDFLRRFNISVLGPDGLAFAGDFQVQAGRPERGLPCLQRILDQFPESAYAAVAHVRMAEADVQARAYSNAYAHASAAVAGAGEPELLMDATFALAESLRGLERFDEAVEAYNTVLANRAASRRMKPEALLGIAACRHAQGKPGEAIPYYQRIYVMYQAYTNAVATAYLRSGEAFEQLNDREAAIRTYREMLGIGTVARTPEAQKAREHLARLGS